VFFPSGLHTVVFAPGMSLRLPRTISLVFDPGAVLRLRQVKPNGEPPVPLRAADVLLTIEGHVDAGLHQIFDLFDSSGLSLGAPAQVHGQMLGPWGNEELYPQWWGAQSDPDNLAWNLPESGNPPLKMAGDRVGHVESVDSLALQLCLNASRSGQTVCFAGDFHLANIQLGREPGETSAELIEGRAPGDNLLLEGYGIHLELAQFGTELSKFGGMIALFVYNQASSWAANILQFIFHFFMMVLIIFFLLIDRGRLVNYIMRLSPLPDEHEKRLISRFEEISRAILIGNGICGLIQGVVGGVVLGFWGFSSPIIWGVAMAILAFLPIVGIGLVLLPAAFILLLQGNVTQGLAMVIFYMVLSLSVEYLLKPKMVGVKVKMHTLLVFLSIIGGLQVFGVMGIIYGPLIATGFLTLADIYIMNYDQYVKSTSYLTGRSSQSDRSEDNR